MTVRLSSRGSSFGNVRVGQEIGPSAFGEVGAIAGVAPMPAHIELMNELSLASIGADV